VKCIDNKGRVCPFLKFNQKGNLHYHCNFDKTRPVQVCAEDLRVAMACPLNIGKTECQ
jgi:hypothetical protein